MFTGIIEAIGEIIDLRTEGTNIHFTIESTISSELKIDQSVSHDGVCLTVIKIIGNSHIVTAVEETLQRSNLKHRKPGDKINLERSMTLNKRLDGHLVQGHVDDVVQCTNIESADGSWKLTFRHDQSNNDLLVDKGSVCVNGVSLTVINPTKKKFSVAIIPYTFEHTNFQFLKEGDVVNIEYDIIGKYVKRIIEKGK